MERYFIIPVDSPEWDEIMSYMVQKEPTLRLSLDGTKAVVKLFKGDDIDYECLEGFVVYDLEGITIEMDKPEWSE